MTENNWQLEVLDNKKNQYILIAKIGSGSYASVWMCYWVNSKKLMAVKIFKTNEHKSAKKEAEIYLKFNQLNVRNIIKMYDNFVHKNAVCLVFDLMVGSLYSMIKNGKCQDKNFHNGFPVDFVVKAMHGMLETLTDLHDNHIVHGDIKPENILLFGTIGLHQDLVKNLTPKSSVKRIGEAIKAIYRNINIPACQKSSGSSESQSQSHTDEAKQDSDDSLMSHDPELIVPSDSDDQDDQNDQDDQDDQDQDDQDQDDQDDQCNENDMDEKIDQDNLVDQRNKPTTTNNHQNINNMKQYLEIEQPYIDNPIIKLADLGSYVDLGSDKKKPTSIQTKYYRAPEILLGLPYNETCDIWALACSIYEMMTGKILFNPDHYKMDQKRCIMILIYSKLGSFPPDLIDQAPLKQVFYTESHILKGTATCYNEFQATNTWSNLLACMNCGISGFRNPTIIKYMLLDLLFDMLTPDPRKRISARNALQHPLFGLYGLATH
jgi:serine/threonine-protein kinase SRPK3